MAVSSLGLEPGVYIPTSIKSLFSRYIARILRILPAASLCSGEAIADIKREILPKTSIAG